jgi:hypothetical protein
MKASTILLSILLASSTLASARFEQHERQERINTPFTIELPYPASWKVGLAYEEHASSRTLARFPMPLISWTQEILPAIGSDEAPEYLPAKFTFTACKPGNAIITFSLPHKSENAEIPDDVLLVYTIEIQ